MLTGKVIDLSSDGWGVVKEDSGRVCFVPGAWPGDIINFEIVSEGKFTLGRLLSWVQKSPAHRASPCKYWGFEDKSCRACEWIHIEYSEQLKAKEKKLDAILKKFTLAPRQRHPIKSGKEFNYRNRIKLSSDGTSLGFKIPMSNKIAAIEECIVAEEWISEEIRKLSAKSVVGEKWIQKSEDDSFAQGNTSLNTIMRETLESLLTEKKKTLELFSGEGNFTEILLKHSTEVSAYESAGVAIEKLKRKWPEVKAHVLNLYSRNSLKDLAANKKIQRLFLDPPRSGYKDLKALTERLPELEEVIYLSCDPMTFARDASLLKEWSFESLFAFDLFPQTPHLEVMGYWKRIS